MAAPLITGLAGAEVRVFEPDPGEGDVSRMYVLDALGLTVNVYQRKDGGTYVGISADDSADAPPAWPLIVNVCESGENTYGEPEPGNLYSVEVQRNLFCTVAVRAVSASAAVAKVDQPSFPLPGPADCKIGGVADYVVFNAAGEEIGGDDE